MKKIGFMQGRLSPKPSDRIQAFPKDSWREEFPIGRKLGFDCMEVIYDDYLLEYNPLNTSAGRKEMRMLAQEHGIALHSICSDYFMRRLVEDHYDDALKLFDISVEIGCPLVEFPFVGPATLHKRTDRSAPAKALAQLVPEAEKRGLRIALETDLPPVDFRDFMAQYPASIIGANVDLGNSAMWGWDIYSECRLYGDRIFNVHIKDGVIGGSTVPLLTGHTDFTRCFKALKDSYYKGDFILQTAPDNDYLGVAEKYKNMTREWAAAL